MNKETVYALLSCVLWGFFPLALKALKTVSAPEILATRVVFAFLCVVILLLIRRQWSWLGWVLRRPSVLCLLGVSALLLGGNWLLYIWAVTTNRIIESSLGYFIAPFINIILGVLFFQERLTFVRKLGIGIAAIGVLIVALSQGSAPWISLVLALAFSGYAILHKVAPLNALEGLAVEMLLLSIPASLYLFYLKSTGVTNTDSLALLGATGVFTVLLLLLYTASARKLPLSTLGILQYLTPTLQFLLGVLLYHEPFTSQLLFGFSLIWLALLLYSSGAWLWSRPVFAHLASS
jgi:chloramphenicol-sensitive protein RarD